MEAVCLAPAPHILLAEDDAELRELLALVLEGAGYRVTQCANGLQLLRQMESADDHALIISDLRMPGLSGLEVLERQCGRELATPFICMTAFGDEQTHNNARQLGAVATIDKPFDLDEMIALVEGICLRNDRNSRSRP
ncbi:MAG: response regulator [Pelovirga sp.]|jgi:DNA-binding NtrC family response regulator